MQSLDITVLTVICKISIFSVCDCILIMGVLWDKYCISMGILIVYR